MKTTDLSILVHGVLALAVVAASTILAIDLKTIPPDVAGIFGVVIGVAGVNGVGAARAGTRENGNGNGNGH